jgi:phenylalanyl-tRNA synthetase beta chain
LVTPPSWRPDLTDPNDLAEEVIRLEGYERIPSRLPTAPRGRGLTLRQRLHRRVGRSLADAGYVEVLNYPFVGKAELDAMGIPEGDARRSALTLVNPISDEQPQLRTTLLPGLFATLRRNVGRGFPDVALFETGLVYQPRPGVTAPPRLPVDHRPSNEELAALDASLPDQPRHVAAVLTGTWERAGWWGEGRQATWADAVEAARTVAAACGAELTVDQEQYEPWHPGRCAVLSLDERIVGYAGELHPKVLEALGLPPRTCAMELNLDALVPETEVNVRGPEVSAFPVAAIDVALVVSREVPAADVESALIEGAGPLLESVNLFDVYEGDRIEAGTKSLAFSLRLRAADRTLKADEVAAVRDSAVASAARHTDAVLRG